MKGEFEYKDKDGNEKSVRDSKQIPEDATELLAWLPDIPPPPHSLEDHKKLDAMLDEFEEVYARIYGTLPEKK